MDPLAIDSGRQDLEYLLALCYKGYIVRSRLKRVPNEAMKCNTFTHDEEVWRFPFRYINFVKSPDGHIPQLNLEMYEAFRVHFRDHLAHCPDLPVQKFHSYLADFPHLWEAEIACCKGLVTECEIRDTLKQVSLNKSPELDGLPYKVYLRLPHMFVPILMDVFNLWFAQGAIPGSITTGMIIFLKKGGRQVWERLDDYRPITLLNTELKILAQVFAACH